VVDVADGMSVTDVPCLVEVASIAFDSTMPDHSEILMRQVPAQAVESVVETLVPEPLEFRPYQISESRLELDPTALVHVTPPPEIDEIVELDGLPPKVKMSVSPE